MSKKYFDTKTGSLEEKITKIATEQQSIVKQEPNVKLKVERTYFDVKPGSVSDVAAKVVSESFIKENTYAFDYNFELYMPSTSQRGDGDAIKEYEGTIKASGKDAGEAKPKAEKELQRRIDAAEKATKGTLETEDLGPGRAVSEALDPVNKDAVKKKFDDRKDKDIDNDGDTDSTDKYLHKRRAAISKATSEAVMPDDKGEKINQMKHKKTKEGEKEIVKLKEDDMAKFHKMQKDGKSANDIAKALDLDVKSTKKLMDAVDNPYAVGMAQAMKSKNDEPPLKKSTITKAHDIAKSIMKKEEVSCDCDCGQSPCVDCGKDHHNMKENKKSFSDLRTETKVIKLGYKGKTATGKDAGAVDVEPSARPV